MTWLRHFGPPVLLSGMGLGGMALMWKKAAGVVSDVPSEISDVFTIATACVLCLCTLLFIIRAVKFPDTIRSDLDHPVFSNTIPAFNIVLLILSRAAVDEHETLARVLFWAGASLQLFASLYFISRWFQSAAGEVDCNPSCLIPVVGLVLVAVPGGKLGYADTSLFYVAAALLFWSALQANLFQKLVHHHPAPPPLIPTYTIMLAPPAVASLAIFEITGNQFGYLARSLALLALFFELLMIAIAPLMYRAMKKTGYKHSWWGLTFPTSATATAMLQFHKYRRDNPEDVDDEFSTVAAYFTVILATLLTLFVLASLIIAIVRGKAFVAHPKMGGVGGPGFPATSAGSAPQAKPQAADPAAPTTAV